MADKKELRKVLILNNPNLSGNKLYNKIKGTSLGVRKTDFYKELREIRSISEPSIVKKDKSTPIKYRTNQQKKRIAKRKVSKPKRKPIKVKPTKIPFEKTKFGKIAKGMEKTHGISERRAIERARALLKIPRKDYAKLNQKDVKIILIHSP